MPNFLHRHYYKNYHGVYQHAKKLFIFDLVLLATSVAMFGAAVFLFLWKPTLVDLIDLSISLGNNRIRSGEEVRLTVDYTNKSKYRLQSISLALHLPDGFVVDRSKTPTSIFSDSAIFSSLKDLDPGAKGRAELYGWFWSTPAKEENFTANLSYKPENNNNREQKLAGFVAKLADSSITAQLEIPTSTLVNSLIKFKLSLKNIGANEVKNISVASNWGSNILDPKDTTNITLPANGTKIIEGQFTVPNRAGKYLLSFSPQILVNNRLITQAPASREIQAYAAQIISSAALAANTGYGEPRQTLPIQISWENKSSFKLQNLALHLTSNLIGVVDWKKTAVENNAKLEKNGISFSGSSRTKLSDGNPNSGDNFTATIYLLPTFTLPDAEKVSLEIFPVITANLTGATGQEFSQEGSRLSLPLATEVDFSNIEARYYTAEGDQLGRGPLPPQVGKTTKYWVFVKITNTTNALANAVFNASLPAGIDFTGKQSASIGPQIDYNSATRAISWKYSALPANSQTGLYFEVSVTPNSTQIGQNILLTNSLRFSATDEFTGKKFDLSHSPITNILNSDDAGQGLGSKVR